MTIPAFSGRTIRVRWPEAAAWLALCGALAPAQQGQAPRGGALAAAVAAAARGEAGAAERLAAHGSGHPQIADFLAYWRAQALAGTRRFEEAAAALGPVWQTRFPSSIAGRAAVLGAESLVKAGRFADALKMLERGGKDLPEPQATLAAALAREGLGEKIRAVELYRRVYCLYPLAKESSAARDALAALEKDPALRLPPMPDELLAERAARLAAAGRDADARAEWLSLARSGAAQEMRETARVRAAAALYSQRKTRDALAELGAMRLTSAEAEAERMHFIVLCHRRLDDPQAMLEALAELRRRAPRSRWTLLATIQAANHFLIRNEAVSFVPLLRACAEDFSEEPEAAGCHWKVAWRAWLDRSAAAEDLLKGHLSRHPGSDRAGTALYFLGRLEEERSNFQAAHVYYSELKSRFPNFYYATLAASKPQPAAGNGGGAGPAARFLESIRWPERPRNADFRPGEEAKWRIARARHLAAESLGVWAEIELRFGARNGSSPYALALEAAEIASARGAWGVAVRHIRGTVPGYLWLPREAAPRRFWELAFPFPYRDLIQREARKHGLDPLLVAALIRQESEFDPDAVSPSGAIGLMQVMPATGRELGRRLRMRPVTRRALHNPGVNVTVGTYFLARLLGSRQGRVEEALAAYNAGPTRIPVWTGWGEFREPAEFVETIPLQQTRDYVQIILRNREIYRWLYRPQAPAAGRATGATAKPRPAASAKPAPKAKPASKAKPRPSTRPRKSSLRKGAKSVAGKR